MLVDPMDNCAQTGQPVSFSVDGPGCPRSNGTHRFRFEKDSKGILQMDPSKGSTFQQEYV